VVDSRGDSVGGAQRRDCKLGGCVSTGPEIEKILVAPVRSRIQKILQLAQLNPKYFAFQRSALGTLGRIRTLCNTSCQSFIGSLTGIRTVKETFFEGEALQRKRCEPLLGAGGST
jgi:hypothetical protein